VKHLGIMHLTNKGSKRHGEHVLVDDSASAGAPDEIEVTFEMAEAGGFILSDRFDQPLDWLTLDIATAIYRAMHSCAP
jgi:hypothetical protein